MIPVMLRGERVLLRPWIDTDRAPFATMNADPEVMRYFVAPLSREQSDALVQRLRTHIDTHGFGLWAMEAPDAEGVLRFAGFVGLSASVPFTLPLPGIVPAPHEIGWRLARWAWGRGYASEAAALALQYAFDELAWPQLVSFTAAGNLASQAVMRRIGLTPRGGFDHPRIDAEHRLCRHVLYAQDAAQRRTRHA